MRRIILAVLIAVTLGGCAQYMWVKNGATDAEFRKDRYECERDMRQSGYYGGGLYGALNMMEFGEQCMRARGYQKTQADASARLVQ